MKNLKKVSANKGFTLIEILVVIGIIAVLAAIVIVAINPGRQFAQARNTQRTANVNAILNAIGQNMADNKGIFTCDENADGDTTDSGDDLPSSPLNMSETDYDIRQCIVPVYITEVPFDPAIGSNNCGESGDADCTDSAPTETYDSGYTVETEANGRIKVCAPESDNEDALPGVDEICVTR